VLSDVVVETHIEGESWQAVWRHQVRWARTIRVSRFQGYAGLPVTFATLWALVAVVCGAWWTAAALMLIRMTMAIVAGWWVLGSADVLRYWWLIPARDLFSVAVWIAGLSGHAVYWGGVRLRLTRDGRIEK
jgi:ceramide glucosyltransferase